MIYFPRALLGINPSRIIYKTGYFRRYAMPHYPPTRLRVLHLAPLREAALHLALDGGERA